MDFNNGFPNGNFNQLPTPQQPYQVQPIVPTGSPNSGLPRLPVEAMPPPPVVQQHSVPSTVVPVDRGTIEGTPTQQAYQSSLQRKLKQRAPKPPSQQRKMKDPNQPLLVTETINVEVVGGKLKM